MPIRLQLLLFGVIGNVLVAAIFIFSFGYRENIQEDSSEVLLITDLKSTLPVFSEESKLKFFVTGGKKYLNIKHLESRNALKDGEIILSTSTSGYFKKGIKVGTVRKKVNEIIIEPLAKKNDSVYVKVLIYDFDKLQPNFLK